MDVSSMAALRAEQLKAASHSGGGAQQQHQHQQSSALAAAAAEKAPSHVLVARALGAKSCGNCTLHVDSALEREMSQPTENLA
jgi:hypothetical protein